MTAEAEKAAWIIALTLALRPTKFATFAGFKATVKGIAGPYKEAWRLAFAGETRMAMSTESPEGKSPLGALRGNPTPAPRVNFVDGAPGEEAYFDMEADEHYENLARACYTNSASRKRDSLSYLIDSGATHCFQNTLEAIKSYTPFASPKPVKMGDDSVIYAKGHGLVTLILPSQAALTIE
ncbi:hypothetical protein ACJ73_07446, partial [Blastomyces percursus]